MRKILFSLLLVAPLTYCAHKASKTMSLDAAVAGDHRSDESRQRDKYRNPVETLKFFDVQADMDVVEVSPGTGWYTEILAPYLTGKLYLAAFSDKSEKEYYIKTNEKLKAKIATHKAQFGNIEMTTLEMPNNIGPIAPANSVDRVLTFRNVHNWIKAKKATQVFKEFHRVLRKGGILGVVEHRANEKTKVDAKTTSGYVHTQQVIDLAKSAGFKLVASSEINANPRDLAVYPKGVWTLPPRLRLGEKNKAKYMKIGESDRMTLKFIKE